MTGRDILKDLYKTIHNHYNLTIADFDDSVDNFHTNDDTIDELVVHPVIVGLPNIVKFLEIFRNANIGPDYLNDEFIEPHSVGFINFTLPIFRKRNRKFSFSDNEFGYLSLRKMFDEPQYQNVGSLALRPLIDFVSTNISRGNPNDNLPLLDYVENANAEIGVLVYKIALPGATDLSVYAYLYYKTLLSGKTIPLDSTLNYSTNSGAVVNYNVAYQYQQYFELYDIANEVNHANDLITRYLKMYHLYEYLVYRVELVELEKKARINRTFIREIHSLTGKGQVDKELPLFKKSFKKIFSVELAANAFDVLLPINAAETTFLLTYYGLNVPVTANDKANYFCTLIYMIRNSIVHNKESEFHITTTNPDEYRSIIVLMSRMIERLELLAYNKISDNDITISYQSPHIELY